MQGNGSEVTVVVKTDTGSGQGMADLLVYALESLQAQK